MPNRIETLERQGQLCRFYIDGDYNPAASEGYRLSTHHVLSFPHLGEMVRFEQPSNLHSGSFFLNREQAAFMPAVAMQQQLTSAFTALWRVLPLLGCLRHFS